MIEYEAGDVLRNVDTGEEVLVGHVNELLGICDDGQWPEGPRHREGHVVVLGNIFKGFVWVVSCQNVDG